MFRFGSCEQFWSIYSHLVRPGDLSSHSDFHLFKMGIKPMWEDETNRYRYQSSSCLHHFYIDTGLHRLQIRSILTTCSFYCFFFFLNVKIIIFLAAF